MRFYMKNQLLGESPKIPSRSPKIPSPSPKIPSSGYN